MKHIRPFSLVRELFERIRQDGTKITLASSANEDEVNEYKKLLEITDLVDEAASADDAEQSKPSPDIFAAALERLGNPPVEEVIVIGDTPYDAQAATALGLRCLGVLSGGFSEEELRSAGCIAVFRGPAELLARYDESSLKRLLKSYTDYYHRSRTHLSLEKDSPIPRPVMSGSERIISIPQVGGLHHRYERAA